ncbi:MAG: hypothetical protein EAZ89_19465 [Bacteroidetes bacterium]|nr:MAG: hypothetical protein EAZ89_19465 [Bacteroidota bacterium]
MRLRFLALPLLNLLFLSAHAQEVLRFQVWKGWEYLLKTPPGSDSLIRSEDPTLDPWMPAGQQGWQLNSAAGADVFFRSAGPAYTDTLFERWVVLAWVRHDPWLWDLEVRSATFDPLHAQVHIEVLLHPIGARRKQPLTSTAVILLKKTPALQKTGPTNLRFLLREQTENPDPDLLLQTFTSGDLMFPPAWSYEELRQCWESYQTFLEAETEGTEESQP